MIDRTPGRRGVGIALSLGQPWKSVKFDRAGSAARFCRNRNSKRGSSTALATTRLRATTPVLGPRGEGIY
jgi:hypothetical protein